MKVVDFYKYVLVQTFYIDREDMLLWMPMDRTEAIIYLKEVLTLCGEMTPESVYFENPKNSDSSGYRVHIKGKIQEMDMQKIREIAKKHNLEIKENPDGIIVYKSA